MGVGVGTSSTYKSPEDDIEDNYNYDSGNNYELMGIDDDVTSDDESPTDAEVSKYSFQQRLVHYLGGGLITERNHKAVEINADCSKLF